MTTGRRAVPARSLGTPLRALGFTLVEMAVVITLIGILAATLLDRVFFYQEQAEKTSMDQTVGIVRSALHLQIADLLVKSNMPAIAQLADQNPMNWLAEKPKNYAGEYYDPRPGVIENGNWYFDLRYKNLVYLVNAHDHLHTLPGEANKIRFKAKLVMSANDPSALQGVVLEPVVRYNWF